MKKYTYNICFTDGQVETGTIKAPDYLTAMRTLHRRCNKYINIGHRSIKQTLLG